MPYATMLYCTIPSYTILYYMNPELEDLLLGSSQESGAESLGSEPGFMVLPMTQMGTVGKSRAPSEPAILAKQEGYGWGSF